MANKKRNSFRPVTIFFETDPLTLVTITLVHKPETDKHYAILKDKSGVTFMCFESITYTQLLPETRYKFAGMVNVTPGNIFLAVNSFELIHESNEFIESETTEHAK